MKKAVLIILTFALLAIPGLAARLDTGFAPEGLDELTKGKGRFKTTLIHPDADFSRYTKLNPRKVMLVVESPALQIGEPATGSLIGKTNRSIELPPPEELDEFREIVNQAIIDELAAGADRQLVKEYGPDTLVLRVTIIDIVFSTAKSGGERVPAMSKGTIVFDLIDGESGVIQARFGEQRKCPKEASPGSAVNPGEPWPNLDLWAELAAADLCRELDPI